MVVYDNDGQEKSKLITCYSQHGLTVIQNSKTHSSEIIKITQKLVDP